MGSWVPGQENYRQHKGLSRIHLCQVLVAEAVSCFHTTNTCYILTSNLLCVQVKVFFKLRLKVPERTSDCTNQTHLHASSHMQSWQFSQNLSTLVSMNLYQSFSEKENTSLYISSASFARSPHPSSSLNFLLFVNLHCLLGISTWVDHCHPIFNIFKPKFIHPSSPKTL